MSPIECNHLDAYIGGWLFEPERSRFEAHLRQCPRCRAELSVQQRVDALLSAARDRLEPVDPLLVARVEQTLEREAAGRAAAWIWAGLAAAASVLFLLSAPFVWRVSVWLPGTSDLRQQPSLAIDQRRAVTENDQRTAMQQLALFVTGEGPARPAGAHRWVRLVTIPPPPEKPRPAHGSPARGRAAKPASPEAQERKELVITRGPPPFNARAVQRPWTLGQRRLGGAVGCGPGARSEW
jgi:anti-sigma factor RsiW